MGIKISNTDIADIRIGGVGALRVMRGGQEVWSGGILPVSATVDASGYMLAIVFNAPAEVGADGMEGFTLALSGGSIALLSEHYVGGVGTAQIDFELPRAVAPEETGVLEYIQPGDGWKRVDGGALASFASLPIGNDSLYSGGLPDLPLANFPGTLDGWTFRLDVTIPASEILETGNFFFPVTPQTMGEHFLDNVQDGWKDFRPVVFGGTTALQWRACFMDKSAGEFFAEVRCAVTAATEFKLSIYFGNGDTELTSTSMSVGDFALSPDISHWFDVRKTDPAWGGDWKAYTLTGTTPVSAGLSLVGGVQWPDRDGYLTADSIFFGGSAGARPNTALCHAMVPADAEDPLVGGGAFCSFKSSGNPALAGQRCQLAWIASEGNPVLSQYIGSNASINYAIPEEYRGTECIVGFGCTTNDQVSNIANWPVFLVNDAGAVQLTGTWVNQPASSTVTSLAFGGTWHIGRSSNDASPANGISGVAALRVFRTKSMTAGWLNYQWRMYYQAHAFCTTATLGNDLVYQGVPLPFTLDSTKQTTGEVVDATTGKRIRRVWGGLSLPAGSHTKYWDKRDDRKNLMPAGTYTFRLLKHNAYGNWDGVVAATSFVTGEIVEGPNQCHRGLWHYEKIAFTADGEAHIAPGANEGQPRALRVKLANIQKPYRNYYADYRDTYYWCATDDTMVYYVARHWPAPTNEYHTFIHAFDSDSTAPDMLEEHTFGATGSSRIPLFSVPRIVNDIHDKTFASGFAVQQSGDCIFVGIPHLDELRVYSKTDKSLLHTLSFDNARRFDVDTDDNLVFCYFGGTSDWRIARLTNVGTTNDIADIVVGLADPPLDLAIRRDGEDSTGDVIAIYAGGSAAQVRRYSAAGSLLGTLGDLGGYANGPTVSNTRFDPIPMRIDGGPSAMVSYDRSGRLWIGDWGNCRILVHDATTFAVVDRIHPGQAFYMCEVSQTEPTRLFRHWLEYEINYDEPDIEDSWTLVRNWRYTTVPNDGEGSSGLAQVRRFYDGETSKTLALVRKAGAHHQFGYSVVILPDDGAGQAIDTARTITRDGNWDISDGAIMWLDMDSSSTHNLLKTKAFIGFDEAGLPNWAANWTTSHSCSKGQQEPDPKQPLSNGAAANNGLRYGKLANGRFVVYRNGQNPNHESYIAHHLGFVEPGGNVYADLAMPGAGWYSVVINNRTILTFANDEGGTFDDNADLGNGYAGNKAVIAPGNTFSPNGILAVGYHGEFWGGGQAGQVIIYDERGTYITQIGQPFSPIQHADFPRPRIAGNNFGISFVKIGIRYFVWFNDEGGWGSPHRWEILGLDTCEYVETEVELVEVED